MEPTVGIICEYDPFHRGHARQFELARERLPGTRIVCVMSGCFTQRGMPALFPPAFRAERALAAGAEAVLELPCAFAVREAEHFALGSVGVLDALGFVTHLCFGVETDDPPLLAAAAALLEAPDAAFTAALRAGLDAGKPFAAAQAAAAAAGLAGSGFSAEAASRALARPNNILALCYLRALLRLKSGIEPLPVNREGDYHADRLAAEGWPSASAARKAFLSGNLAHAEVACGYPLAGVPFHRPEALDTVLLHRLREAEPSALRALPDCSEGLENRLARAARAAGGRAELLSILKTKRYAYARLNRLLAHALLNVTADTLAAHPMPEYVRLLGFRRDARSLLANFNQSGIPVIAKAADGDAQNPLYALDARAWDLWALGAGLPAGLMYRQPVVIV